MTAMRTTIEALKQAGVRERVKVMVGCAPVTRQLANRIGADGYGESTPGTVSLPRHMIAPL